MIKKVFIYTIALMGVLMTLSACSQEDEVCIEARKKIIYPINQVETSAYLIKVNLLKNTFCGLDTIEMQMLSIKFMENYFYTLPVMNADTVTPVYLGTLIDEVIQERNSEEYLNKKEDIIASWQEFNNLFVIDGIKEFPDYSKICDTPKYWQEYVNDYTFNNIPQYYDYEEALNCVKEQGKILMVYFTGHSCINSRKLEKSIFKDEEISEFIKKHFILVSLFCDDKNIDEKGDTTGIKNLKIQHDKFNTLAQPYVVFVNSDGEKVGGGFGYINDKALYLNEMKRLTD